MDRLSGCCENMNLPPCVWFEGDKRNAYAAIVSGFMVNRFFLNSYLYLLFDWEFSKFFLIMFIV